MHGGPAFPACTKLRRSSVYSRRFTRIATKGLNYMRACSEVNLVGFLAGSKPGQGDGARGANDLEEAEQNILGVSR
jgi:hypothetical protein